MFDIYDRSTWGNLDAANMRYGVILAILDHVTSEHCLNKDNKGKITRQVSQSIGYDPTINKNPQRFIKFVLTRLMQRRFDDEGQQLLGYACELILEGLPKEATGDYAICYWAASSALVKDSPFKYTLGVA